MKRKICRNFLSVCISVVLIFLGNASFVYSQEETPAEIPEASPTETPTQEIQIADTPIISTEEATATYTLDDAIDQNTTPTPELLDDVMEEITLTPTPTSTEVVLAIPALPSDKEIIEVIQSDFMEANSTDPYAYITRDLLNIEIGEKVQSENWLIIYFKVDNENISHSLIGFYKESWQLVSDYSNRFLNVLGGIPQNLFDNNILKSLASSSGEENVYSQAIYTYDLPYKAGTSKKLSQEYSDSHPAYDFSMSAGTKIYAVTSGTVIAVKVNTKSSCYKSSIPHCTQTCLDSGNYIAIQNTDGNRDYYVHLQQDGSIVNKGDSIAKGQIIGSSGNTGCSSGAHLHFQEKSGISGSSSTQVYFNTYGALSANNYYCSVNNSSLIPTPTKPNSIIYSRKPTFSWSPIPCATKYILQVYNTSVEKELKKADVCSSTLCSYNPGVPLSSGVNKFRVKAYINGSWYSYSSFQSFTVVLPTQISPPGGINSIKPTYKWNQVSAANKYYIQIYKGTSLIYYSTISGTSLHCSNSICSYTPNKVLKNATAYKWRIKAYINGNGQSYTDFVAFITP